jgi:pyruvate dehydrogenase E2 component (dihydrolipoamide acetyltransferase)
MTNEFKLPAVGENIDKAEIGGLRVAVGDTIAADQIVMEIETDKAVFELPCPTAGKVTKIHVKPGDTVQTGAPLLTIEDSAAAAGKKDAAQSTPEKNASDRAPDESEAASPESPTSRAPAATAQAPPPAAGKSAPAKAKAAPPPPAAPQPRVAAPDSEGQGDEAAPAPAGPATRRMARELGVDLHGVKGSGPGGRITSEDVQAYVRERLSRPTAEPAAAAIVSGSGAIPPLPDFSSFGALERQPMNKVMRVAAANLSLAWNVIPHVTQHELADVTELEAARKRYADSPSARAGGPKITMTVLAMKAVVTALKAFPQFNSTFDASRGEVVLKKYYNLGIAVDTEQGLVVPVIRSVDSKSILQLAGELTELAQKARDRKLAPADMQGGSFTITNLGGIGGTYFTPIVNYPEVAILGMSRTSQQQVIVDGAPQIRLMLPLSLSYDHRVINGADAARFIVKLARLLSDPFQLMSEV